MSKGPPHLRDAWLPAFLVVASVAGSIWPLFIGRRFAFRDVNHFYRPLYDYVADRTSQQWLPMWNPLDHNGIPLIGESSTAVLYPVRYVVYSIFEGDLALNVYLGLHLFLAAATAATLARSIGCGRWASAVASVTYALSGSVFSLCCNPPFLVGAAWLPVVLRCVYGNSVLGSKVQVGSRTAVCAFSLAMMILGGDPQCAFHATFVGGMLVLFAGANWRSSLVVLTGAVVLAAGLSSVQLAASFDWSRQSSRLDSQSASTIEVRDDTFDFSLPPWHSLELVTPRPFGEPFPINRRLSRMIPGDGRMWTPSIYAGFFVAVAVFAALIHPQRSSASKWIIIATVAWLMSLGHFGPVWIAQQFGLFSDVPSAVGGAYWLLAELVPPYQAFRYPVKWLPVFAIACSMIAGRCLDQLTCEKLCRTVTRAIVCCIGFAMVLSLISLVLAFNDGLKAWADSNVSRFRDEYYGPLQVEEGFKLASLSWVWTALVAGLLLYCVRVRRVGRDRLMFIVLAVIAIDVIASAQRLLPAVPSARSEQLYQEALQGYSFSGSRRWLRTQSGVWPKTWKTTHSPERMLEASVSERLAFFGRWHLEERQAVFNSMVSLRSSDYVRFWRSVREQRHVGSQSRSEQFWSTVQNWLAIEGIVHTTNDATSLRALDLVSVEFDRTNEDSRLRLFSQWSTDQTIEQIVEGISRSGLPPVPSLASEDARQFGDGTPAAMISSSGSPSIGTVESIEEGSDWCRVNLRCDGPILLERTAYQDGNWSAEIRRAGEMSADASVFRSSVLHQAVHLPDAGRWEVTFRYEPWWKFPALACTAASLGLSGWLALGGMVPAMAFRRTRPSGDCERSRQ